jgi:hypothetical protein
MTACQPTSRKTLIKLGSSILRPPTVEGDVWCKSVPPFLAHEGAIIALVGADQPTLVPLLLASDPPTGTVLLGDVPGDDEWGRPKLGFT